MAGGIILILMGVLIALYPQLLAIIVAVLFILLGVLVMSAAHFHRKFRRHAQNPVTDFFLRF